MKTKFGVLAAGFSLFCSAVPVVAHHSFAAEYDANKPVSLKGVVTKFEWTNPHARFYVDVTDEKGSVTNWNFELASPSALGRNGWTSRSLKVGEQVMVTGFGAKSAAHRVNAKSVILSDGRSLFTDARDDAAQ